MKQKNDKQKVLLCGSFHGNNFGDLAILDSMLSVIPKDFEISVLSVNPEQVQKKIGIDRDVKFINPQKFLLLLKTITSVDKVIIGGGGLFFDRGLGDILNFKKGSQIFVWSLISIISKILDKEVFWAGVSTHPNTFFGEILIRLSGIFIDSVFARDKSSFSFFEKLVGRKKVFLSADWTHLNDDIENIKKMHERKIPSKPRVALILKTDWGEKNFVKLAKVTREIEKLKNLLSNFKIVMFSTNPKSDNFLAEKIANTCKLEFVDTSNMDLTLFKNLISGFDLIISERMHALILGYFAGVLGIGLSCESNNNLKKIEEFQNEIYEDGLFLSQLDAEAIVEKIEYVKKNEKNIRKNSFSKAGRLRIRATTNTNVFEKLKTA